MLLSSRSDYVARRRVESRLCCLLLGSGSSFPLARPSLRTDGRGSGCSTRSNLSEPGKDAVHLLDDERVPISRVSGRYLRLSFKIFRSGPPRTTPDNGKLVFEFYDRRGRRMSWMKERRYSLESLPSGRWVEVKLKLPIWIGWRKPDCG